MDIFMKDKTLSKGDKKAINIVRQHMKLLLLSDVANLSGKHVLENVQLAIPHQESSLYFRKQQPSKPMLNVWKNKAIPILKKK